MRYNCNYVVMDVETTGLSPKMHQISQVAFVTMSQELELMEQGVSFVQQYDNKIIDKRAMDFTGITLAQMAEGSSADELYKDLVALFKENKKGRNKPIVVGHNMCKFDLPFLNYIFERKGDSIYAHICEYVEDTMYLSREKWGHIEVSNHKLSGACERAGVRLDNAHEALADTQATAELFKSFIQNLRQESTTVVQEGESFAHRKHFQF